LKYKKKDAKLMIKITAKGNALAVLSRIIKK